MKNADSDPLGLSGALRSCVFNKNPGDVQRLVQSARGVARLLGACLHDGSSSVQTQIIIIIIIFI